jgi:hypothetical protein
MFLSMDVFPTKDTMRIQSQSVATAVLIEESPMTPMFTLGASLPATSNLFIIVDAVAETYHTISAANADIVLVSRNYFLLWVWSVTLLLRGCKTAREYGGVSLELGGLYVSTVSTYSTQQR